MVDSLKEDELREDPLAVDMVDLSEGPIILDIMVWISILEPQAESELSSITFCRHFWIKWKVGNGYMNCPPQLSEKRLWLGPLSLLSRTHISLPGDLEQKRKDPYLVGHKWPQFDEKLFDSASILLKDFSDEKEGLQTDFLTLVKYDFSKLDDSGNSIEIFPL